MDWIKLSVVDIILLQETKCRDEFFPVQEFSDIGYNAVFAGQKSYNGVAILSKYPLYVEEKCLPGMMSQKIDELFEVQTDQEQRYIEATTTINGKLIRLISVYVPNGNSELHKGEKLENSSRFLYKMNFFDALSTHLRQFSTVDELVIAGGDYNVAMSEIDLFNPKVAEGTVGFHPMERSKMQELIDLGYKDAFRFLNPTDVVYSWWDYRRSGWEMNKGWRIDYMLTNHLASSSLQNCDIHTATRGVDKASDHVPVVATFKIS
jgi:exodeoxyribonuclease-3